MSKCPTCGHAEPEPCCPECFGSGWVRVDGQIQTSGYLMKACPRGCRSAFTSAISTYSASTVTLPMARYYIDPPTKEN